MEKSEKNEKYPNGTNFILFNAMFDRIASSGFLAILAIFLHSKLHFDTDTATALFHVNEFIVYLFAIVGAIIADCYWGIFKTLVNMSILFAIGCGIMTVGTFEFSFLDIRVMSFIGLTLTMIGFGSMKSNQTVFVGNQFKLPEQSKELDYFFSIHFLVMKFGILLGMFLIPILRTGVKCLGENDCYPLAYGVITASMTVAFIVLIMGNKRVVHVPPSGENVLVNVTKCISYAIHKKIVTISSSVKKDHWLDYSEEKFGRELVKDTKSLLSVLVMYLPLPIFWSLLNQQSSRWVFQATRMNGDIGFYTIKPDQMIVVAPIFIMVLIPVFNHLIFPLVAKIGIKTTLQKIFCGMICASVAFMISAYIETQINKHYISILWLVPQYLCIATAEVLLWVAVIAFAYKEASQNMKSVITASVYLSIGCGSIIVFTISGLKLFDSLVYELLFYAIIMLVDASIFAILAWRYKYRESQDLPETVENVEKIENENLEKV